MEQEKEKNEKKKKYLKIRKRVLAAIMTVCLLFNLIYYAVVKPNCVYATAAVAGYVAGETILSLLLSGMAAAGIYHDVKTKQELDELTKAEQEEYYEEITLNDKGWMKELYDNGFFEGTEIEELVRASIYEQDGTSALDSYIEKQKMKEKLKVITNPNKDPNKLPDGTAAISAGILASWDALCNIGTNLKTALDKAVDAKKTGDIMSEALATLPSIETANAAMKELHPDINFELTRYFLHQTNNTSDIYILYHSSGSVIELYSDTPKAFIQFWNTNNAGILYKYTVATKEWGVENSWRKYSGTSSIPAYSFSYSSGCIKYNSYDILNKDGSIFIPANPISGAESNSEEDINKYLSDYKLAYSEGYQDAIAQTAADTESKLIINDNPEKIEQYLNVPLSEPLANPDPSVDPDKQLQKGIETSINKLPSAITNTNTEALPELSPEDQETFKRENPSYRLNDFEVDGIEDVFPFCIPFDLFRCIKVLCATPEAPRWEFPFKFERWGIDETIVLDLEKFDNIAAISRWIETLIFMWGLASKTKAFMFT